MDVNAMMQVVRNTFRSWRRTPAVALATVLTLAVGVGVSSAIFSVVHAVLFRPLPYPSPERLVEVFEANPGGVRPTFRVSVLNYLSWAERSTTFESLAAFQDASFNISGESARDAERVPAMLVTASLFQVLGVAPLAGRPLSATDERPGSRAVAVLAESFWRARYAADPSVIGRTLTLNGESREIVGVVPDTFRSVGRSRISEAAGPRVFVPLTVDPARERSTGSVIGPSSRGNRVMRVAGRLRPGTSLEQAQAEMSSIAAAMQQEFPATNEGWGVRLESAHASMLDEGVEPALLALLGAVGVVMLIACANVANLMLVKTTGRRRELALRTALGAAPGRLARQLLGESLCLAAVSGAVGIGASVLAVNALRSWLPRTVPRIDEVQVDVAVLGFGIAVALASGVLFGVLPAMRAGRVDSLEALTQDGRGLIGSPRSMMRQGLVAAQVALATALLVGATLLLQSFVRLQNVPLGFDPDGVLTARIGLPRAVYADGTRLAAFYQQLLARLAANPEVRGAALATSAPFTAGVRRGLAVSARIRLTPDATSAGTESTSRVVEHIVSDGYFRTLAIPILAGRPFDASDRAGLPPAVIVSDSVARRLWPGAPAVGQQLERDGRLHDVVGVAGDVRGADDRGARGGGLDRQPREAIYLSATQFPQATMTVLVRTSREAAAAAPPLRAAVRDIDPALPVDQVRPLEDWLADSAAQPRVTTTLAVMFAGTALLLAAVGIYGVVSYTVGERTAEIGLRVAVGATRGRIMALILRAGVMSALGGVMAGLGGAFLVNRWFASLLFEVRPDDPLVFALVAMVLVLVALLACYLPARRASHIDPLAAIRQG
jgi:putative ABC transport system permease protein